MSIALRGALLALLLLSSGCGDAASGVDARAAALFGGVPYGELDRDQARRLLTAPADSDGPVFVVTYKRYRAQAAYDDGRPDDATGAEADARYRAAVEPLLAEAGTQTIYRARVERMLVPLDDPAGWDSLEVVRHASRAALVALYEQDGFRAARAHENAAVERGIVLIATEIPSPFPPEIRRVDLDALPYPPSADDPPVTVAHLIDFNDVAQYADGRATMLTGREALERYEQARTLQAVPLGVRPGIKLAVEGELIGDGRAWDEVRINNFPSRAAFRELVTRESLDQAGYEDREAALADTYAVLAAPLVNLVGYLE